jgi:hypothetical protein
MICHTYKCIFIHQRKCAGCSIIQSFGFEPGDPEWYYMNDGVLSPGYESDPSGYFRFSVVRNPWDRFVSGWKYLSATRHRSLRDVLANLPRDGADYRHLTRPQHTILYDENGRLIVDYIIRFESLQQDFDEVCKIIGKPEGKLPQVNQGSRGPYTDYFDQESREMFLRHFGRDIELFRYEY